MTVRTIIENGVMDIFLDDQKVNVLSELRLNELRRAIREARQAEAIAVIRGRPGVFSAGFDMETFAAGTAPSQAMISAGIETIIDILSHPRPVAIHCTGHAFPMGAFLLLAADLRVGVDGDYRIGLNETAIKIPVPDFAVKLAKARLTPPSYTNIAIARLFSPREAVLAGYLDFVEDEKKAGNLIDEKLTALRSLDGHAFRDTKSRMNTPLIEAIRAVGLPEISL